jgi:hypothetical protein
VRPQHVQPARPLQLERAGARILQSLHAMLLHGDQGVLFYQSANPAFPVLQVHVVNRASGVCMRDRPEHAFNVVKLAIG